MQSDVRVFLSKHIPWFTQALREFECQAELHSEPHDEVLLEELVATINQSLAICANVEKLLKDQPEILKETQNAYREAIRPWFEKSWYMHRALVKPRGYPGDHELLSAIYSRKVRSTGLGGYLDRYFLNTTLGRAVCARLKAARAFLLSELAERGGDVSILNVACGPCREYTEDFAPSNGREIHLTCVDNDTEALEFVEQHVAPSMPHHLDVKFVRYNALRMTSAKNNVEKFGKNDIIYSVGLCDYIPDDYLIPMLRGWRESLAENGVVYVAFKDTELYDKTEYQWLCDWYFYQRTTAQCRQLFQSAGYNMEALEESRTDMDVIINFSGRSNKPSFRRFDDAQLHFPAIERVEVDRMEGIPSN